MTQEEVAILWKDANGWDVRGYTNTLEDLGRFARLVAAKEREACAKVCETHGVYPELNVWNGGPDWYKHGKDCAAAIRARGEQA